MAQLSYGSVIRQIRSGTIETGLSPLLRRAWPRYAYHFTDLQNAISIIEQGKIFSREKAASEHLMANDNASQDVINQTDIEVTKCVRFYFRPKTPTQYNNEGFRNSSTITELNAHCPFPVFFLFDLEKLLTNKTTFFTEKSLAISEKVNYLSTPEEFANLPFDKIYHDRPFPPELRTEIVQHRHAEILVPNEIDLDQYLSRIIVRSPSERQTLINSLTEEKKEKYSNLIRIDRKKNIFFGYWSFIQELIVQDSYVQLEINCGQGKPIFDFRMEVTDLETSSMSQYHDENWGVRSKFKINFKPKSNYEVRVYLNDILAAIDVYDEWITEDLPY